MTSTWTVRGGIPNEVSDDKTADELILANLQNKGGFQGNCNRCGKKGHKQADCRVNNPKGNKTNKKDDGENAFCGREGHTEAKCYRKPSNPG